MLADLFIRNWTRQIYFEMSRWSIGKGGHGFVHRQDLRQGFRV